MQAAAVIASSILLTTFSFPALAVPPELSNGAIVRIKISELDDVWQVGTVDFTDEGCAIVWISDPSVSGSRRGYGLLFLDKLELQQGEVWLDFPLNR